MNTLRKQSPLVFGTQYYRPPTPEAADWDADLARIRDLGMNTIKIWALWGWMEPEPGRLAFDDTDRLLDCAARHDLSVQINLAGVEMAPFWIDRVVPGARRVVGGLPLSAQNSLCCIPAVFSAYCPDHAEIGARMEAFFSATARRYAAHPALLNWDAWNEIMAMGCYCDNTVRAYQQWLRHRYHDTLDNLNREWLRRYCAWEDIRPPERARCGYADMVVWKCFLADHTAEQARRRLCAIKAGDPVHDVMVHADRSCLADARGSLMWGGDDWTLAGAVDLYGTSWAPATTPIEPANNTTTFTLDAIRSAAPGAYWVSELHASGPMVDGFTILDNPPGYREQKFWIWTALAAEAKGILFWQYRPELAGPESPGWGLVHPDGSLTERARELGETGRILRAHAAELAEARLARPPVAILFDPEVALMQQAENSPEVFAASLKGYHRLLWEHNIGCEFLHVRDLARLHDYQLVIMPFPALIKDASVPLLRDYVEQGGHLWAEAYLGRFGDQWMARTAAPPPALGALFGVRLGACAAVRGVTITRSSGEVLALDDGFIVERIEAAADASVLGWSDSARQCPLVVERSAGRGSTVFVGTLFGRAYAQMRESTAACTWMLEMLRSMGIGSTCRVTPPGAAVRCGMLQTAAAAFVICTNHGEDASVEIRVAMPFRVAGAVELYAAPACTVAWTNDSLHLRGVLGARGVWVVRGIPRQDGGGTIEEIP